MVPVPHFKVKNVEPVLHEKRSSAPGTFSRCFAAIVARGAGFGEQADYFTRSSTPLPVQGESVLVKRNCVPTNWPEMP